MNLVNETHKTEIAAKFWANKVLKNQLNSQEQEELAQWLEESYVHKKAFFHHRQQLLSQQKLRRRIIPAGLAIAASMLLFVLMPTSVFESPITPHVLTFTQGKTHILDDGSIVELNVNSEISVLFSDKAREIKLVRGDAWFNVAEDKSRPFIVKHFSTHVTALGTEFAINTHTNIQVQVTEHSVKVKNTSNNQMMIVAEGEGVLKDKSGWRKQTTKELNSGLAWRDQLVIFDSTPLYLALKQLSVYLKIDIELMAAVDENELVTGQFNTNNPQLALEMICDGLGLKQKKLSEKKIILF